MKFSLKWLNDYLGVELQADDLADKLTMAGLEVESIEEIKPVFCNKVVAAKVISVEKHPNADSLHLCQVFNGAENIQIVCGAPNVKAGILVPLALVGSTIQGHNIKKAKLRGVESYGMLCSEDELKLGFDSSGLLLLEENIEPGTPLLDIFETEDIVFELGITPNRGDCLSIRGIAREAAASYDLSIQERSLKTFGEAGSQFSIDNNEINLCPYYGGAIIENIKISKSPFWLRYRLYLAGIRSINNIVDITNYILLDIGQPMHAFDYDKLAEKIVIRKALKSEKVLALDENEYELNENDLVIADSEKAVAIAGVMGLENSCVDENTKKIFLESAFFNPVSVRKTSRRLNLVSDSSYRFERGVDPENIIRSLKMACALCEDLASASVTAAEINVSESMYERRIVDMDARKCSALLGVDLKDNEIQNILAKIDINVAADTNTYSIPGNRNDLEREVDLIEEVARIYGFKNIPLHDEIIKIPTSRIVKNKDLNRLVTEKLAAIGFSESINYSFVSEKDITEIDGFTDTVENVAIANPLSQDQAVMRNSLFSGLARNVFTSLSYKTDNIRFFELGSVFKGNPSTDNVTELQSEHLALILSGKISPDFYKEDFRETDFYDLKGSINDLFNKLNIKYSLEPVRDSDFFKKALKISSGSFFIGVMGEVDNNVAKKYSIKEKLFFCELDFEVMQNLISPDPVYKEFSRFPAIVEDMSFLLDEHIEHEEVLKCLRGFETNLLENIRLFDIYKGKGIPEGKKSMSYSLTYRDSSQTLKTEVINTLHEKIKEKIKTELNVEFR